MQYFYVIAPVGGDRDFSAKRSIVAEAAAPFTVVPLFPLDRHPIVALEHAAENIRNAKFVLADLSFERPSCYFELGVAEATGVEVSIIAKAGTPIHQVGYASQVNFYRDLADYRRLIADILQSRFVSPQSHPLRAANR